MKIELDYARERKIIEVEGDSLTITGTIIVAGDTLIAETGLHMGAITWKDMDGTPLGSLTVRP